MTRVLFLVAAAGMLATGAVLSLTNDPIACSLAFVAAGTFAIGAVVLE
jgi:hypothetical protein